MNNIKLNADAFHGDQRIEDGTESKIVLWESVDQPALEHHQPPLRIFGNFGQKNNSFFFCCLKPCNFTILL